MQQGFSPAEKPTMEQGCATAETIITVQELLEREAYLSVHHYPPVLDAGNVGERKLPCWTNPTSEPTGLSCSLLGSTSSASVNNLNRGAENVSPTGSAGQQMVGLKTENSRLRGSLLCFSEITYFLHGWIQLWNDSPHEANSLAFSDVSGTIPCALTEFDPEILGHPVRLISWSFIFLRKSEGFLEVRQLSMLEISQYLPRRPIFICPEAADVPNLVLETPPSKQKFKSPRHSFAGQVRFISPPFAVPQGECRSKHAGSQTPSLTTKNHLRDLTNCYKKTRVSVHGVSASRSFKVGRGSRVSQGKPLLGFFIGLSPCTHKPSCSIPKMDSSDILENIVDHEDEERYKQFTFYVYFSGSIVAWRPLLLATSGKCVCLTRLRKKVLVANEIGMRYSIYAATRISSIARCTSSSAENTEMGEIGCILHVKLSNFTKDVNQRGNQHLWQQNQVGSYIGIVTEIFLKGGLLELDGHVWLLLTHQPLSHIHGLRVGARVRQHQLTLVFSSVWIKKAFQNMTVIYEHVCYKRTLHIKLPMLIFCLHWFFSPELDRP
ncbi:hypothetical protein KP509_25G006300 [Ceratopteris richardii]|uniref:CST complex subunit CTC1 n=1 Tax=Ceratopteris richardii TaxID=49495 RepID=A0A8T2RMH2_CERRI|nr:hypothetical protein KP509_25G006300 [Ceratopteris richardii]